MNAVRIDLMASAAGKIGGVTWHHLYLIATDPSGKQEFLRCGPQCLPLEMMLGRQSEFGDALEDYETSPVGRYGYITFSTGAYEPGGADFDPVAANVTLASGNSAQQLWQEIQRAAQILQGEQAPYDPIANNANWATMEVLRRCNADASLPPKRWAPGAFTVPRGAAPEGVSARQIGQAVLR